MQFKTPRTLELEARLRNLRDRMHNHLESCHDHDYDSDSGYLDLLGSIDTAARDISWVAPELMPTWKNRWYRRRRVEKFLRDRGVSRTVAKTMARFIP